MLRALLKLPGPAKMDDVLIAAIKRSGPVWLIKAIDTERLRFMHSIRGGKMWQQFGHGWGVRVNDLDLYALKLVNQPFQSPLAPGDISVVKPVTAKAVHDDPPSITNTAVTTGATVATGTVASHLVGMNWEFIMGIIVLIVLAVTGFILYRMYVAGKLNSEVELVDKLGIPLPLGGQSGPTGTNIAPTGPTGATGATGTSASAARAARGF